MTSTDKSKLLKKSFELEKCFRLQQKLATISQRYKEKRFSDLYNLTYWEPIIHTALKTVRSRKGARTSGIDGKTKENVNDNKLLAEIRQELRQGTLQPSRLRQVEIPKDKGGIRKLSIPTYKDRVVLTIIKLILEPIYEPHFNHSSYGFRPNTCTHDAIEDIRQYLGESRRYAWIAETDIEACFDRIHRGRLLEILEERIADGRLIQLIRKYLHAGMAMEGFPENEEEDKQSGCPQGSALSPLLCNIYLDKLDRFVNEHIHRIQAEQEKDKKNLDQKPASVRRRRAYLGSKMRKARTGPFHLIRYADDLVIVSAGNKENLIKYFETVKQFAWDRLRLKFAAHKTSIIHAADGFNFLGFRLKRIYRPDLKKRIILKTVDPRRKERHREKIRLLLKGNHDREVNNVITAINQRVRGWRNYYMKSITNCETLGYIDQLIFWSLIKWLMKKYKSGIKKVMKTFYHRVRTKSGCYWKTITVGTTYLDKAVTALPKYKFDFARKRRHPWLQGKSASDMLKSAFPKRPRAPSWDGTSGYGESYASSMRKALERDNYKCAKCDKTENLNVHHINKRNSFNNPRSRPANCLENLVTLCRECHKFANRLNAIECLNWLLSN